MRYAANLNLFLVLSCCLFVNLVSVRGVMLWKAHQHTINKTSRGIVLTAHCIALPTCPAGTSPQAQYILDKGKPGIQHFFLPRLLRAFFQLTITLVTQLPEPENCRPPISPCTSPPHMFYFLGLVSFHWLCLDWAYRSESPQTQWIPVEAPFNFSSLCYQIS